MVKDLLPTLRAMIAEELKKQYGFRQEESARKLGTTQSAISYYLSGSRGATDPQNRRTVVLKDNPKLKGAVRKIAKAIAENKMTTRQVIQEVCETCMALRSSEDICRIHMNALPSIGKNCNLCQLLLTR